MRLSVTALLAAIRSSLRTRAELEAEILALGHQLAVRQRAGAKAASAQWGRPILVGAALTSVERLADCRAHRETRYRRLLASPSLRLALALAFPPRPSRPPSDRRRRPRADPPDASCQSVLWRLRAFTANSGSWASRSPKRTSPSISVVDYLGRLHHHYDRRAAYLTETLGGTWAPQARQRRGCRASRLSSCCSQRT